MGEHSLVLLVSLNVLNVHVEEVSGVHGSTLSLRVELRGEDRPGLVDDTLVGAIVEVDEVLLEVGGKGRSVDRVPVVLGGDVALTSGQVQGGDVVGTVSVLELDGAGTGGKSEELMTHANTHDRDLGRLHQASEMVDSLLAMSRVTGAVGDEDTVEVVGDLVDGEVVGENSDTGSPADQAAKDVLLHTAVDDRHVQVTVR